MGIKSLSFEASPYYTHWSASRADTRTLCNWDLPDGTVGLGAGPEDNIAAIEVSQLSHAHSINYSAKATVLS